jgi:hypothetical protein
MLEALLKGKIEIIDGPHYVESDPKQHRYNNYEVGDHYALPIFVVELGVLLLQASHQQTQNDNVNEKEKEEDQGNADSLKFYPVL